MQRQQNSDGMSTQNLKFAPPVTSYSLPATAAPPQSIIQNLTFKIPFILQILSSCLKFTQNPPSTIQNFLTPIHPVAVSATTPASGFVEMILHLPIHHPKFKIHNPKSASMLPDNRHSDFSLPPQEMSLTKFSQKCQEAYHDSFL